MHCIFLLGRDQIFKPNYLYAKYNIGKNIVQTQLLAKNILKHSTCAKDKLKHSTCTEHLLKYYICMKRR